MKKFLLVLLFLSFLIVVFGANCQLAEAEQEIYQLVENPEYPEREFYLEKTLSYGDLLLIFILTLALLWAISSKVFNYFWKK
ncbi:MAG TPA: hypothetical protein VMW50_11545 [Dehalococcoidia bacterium]|nr:hypothetical protein [Dehalococcoidia bacterium]